MASSPQDCEDIRQLLARYTYSGDRGRIAELAACFAPDGVLEFPGTRAEGREAILAALGRRGARHPELTFVRHHITSPLIEVDGDRAASRSYFTVYSDNGPDHCGTYTDSLVRTADGWRFAHRLVRIDWQATASLFRPMMTPRQG
jgi:hypothetical protein